MQQYSFPMAGYQAVKEEKGQTRKEKEAAFIRAEAELHGVAIEFFTEEMRNEIKNMSDEKLDKELKVLTKLLNK
jgi:hypothetical protein